ncbi:glycosyltransferase 87 family protein [Dactylosporangium fulvum]|uniref:glycosyltransferase 87 family protein n=1 Tax=Dactylosporangium fulvum TaxID=53359 RepID=UPI0022264271|nr:glycosyltransferase 87 family protein [Dactylosporangium fulvum]
MQRTLPNWLLLPGVLALAVSLGSYLQVARIEGPQLSDPDIEVYVQAGAAFRHGAHVYDLSFTGGHWPFTYPPATLLAFDPLSRLGSTHALVALNTLTVLALVAVALLSLRATGLRGWPGLAGAACAVAAAGLWLEPVQANLNDGQINMLLVLLVLADLTLPDGFRLKGAGVGLATAIKIVPGIFVVYLLITRRFRAALVAGGAFAACTLLGFAVAPRDSAQYWFTGMFASSGRVTQDPGLGGAFNQSLHTLAVRWTHSEAVYYVLAVPVAVLGLVVARRAFRRGDELLGVVCTALTGLLVSPVSWTYHYAWVVPLLVASAAVAARTPDRFRLPAAGLPAVLFMVFLAWPMPGRGDRIAAPRGLVWRVPDITDPSTWHGVSRVLGDTYTLVSLGLLLVAAVWLPPPNPVERTAGEVARSERDRVPPAEPRPVG